METAYDGVFFNGQVGKWAEISDNQKDQIITHMRDIHTAKRDGELAINQAGIDTANQFSWANSAKELINGLV